MSETPTEAPDTEKPEKKWKKTKRFFFLACMAMSFAAGYFVGEANATPEKYGQ